MFLQRSPTVPNASPRRLPGGTVGMMLNHHVFPYGNCRRNRSTESLPELPIPKLTDHLIPRVLDLGPKWHTTKRDSHQIEDSGKWEIHVKYRHILSRFLTDRARSGGLFVDQSNYISLAKYLALFLRENLE